MTATLARPPVTSAPPYPYRHRWLRTGDDWTLIVTVLATRQQLSTTYTIPNAPDVVNAERVAARLYGYRRKEAA